MPLFSSVPKFNRNLDSRLDENLLEAVMVWHGGIQQELTGARSGRVYVVPGTKRRYTASAPGEAPARRTGQLAQSYRYRVKSGLGEVGSPLDHALYLEKGAPRRNLRPRPHLMPAYEHNEKEIKAALSRPIT